MKKSIVLTALLCAIAAGTAQAAASAEKYNNEEFRAHITEIVGQAGYGDIRKGEPEDGMYEVYAASKNGQRGKYEIYMNIECSYKGAECKILKVKER